MQYLPRETDVLIVGGGPAGLATALAVRQKGLRVVVIDSSAPAIDKACGEGLMPGALAALERLGVKLDRSRYVPFQGIRFISEKSTAEAAFPHGVGAGVRRTALHETLVEHAAQAGVHMAWQQRISDLRNSHAYVNDHPVSFRWIVGADGGNSILRRWPALDAGERVSPRFGFRRHYRIEPWSEFMELYWAEGCQMYVTPVKTNEVCIALISRNSQLRIDDALPLFPALARRLGPAVPTNIERGAMSTTRTLRHVHSGRLALVGDASGSVDAITGEGMFLAFQQAIALADAMAVNDLSLYETAHRRIRMRPAMMAHMMLLMDKNSWLQQRALAALAKRPKMFSRMLATHVGAVSKRDMATNIVQLGWSILTI